MIGRRPRIKICGITRASDARLAVALGADAVGFVFWPRSPRAVTPDDARPIAAEVPPFVTRVGVFVNVPAPDVAAVVKRVGLDAVQLHGEEDPAAYHSIGVRLFRSVTLADERDVERSLRLPADVVPLVDAAGGEERGGTGRRANWMFAALLAAERPIVLAGGLRADNVAEAVRLVRPWAVDVSSGVEESPGIKSPERLESFFDGVARAVEEP